jgi:bacillithiol biosynthesis cysteine-adding enzyme BshC
MFATEHLSYDQTDAFSKIVLHYLSGDESLQPFYAAPPTPEGIRQVVGEKTTHPTNRETLVTVLKEQYGPIGSKKTSTNIELLLSPQTFTVCTAHQPNLFSGPLYFIYKILHAIKLADHLNVQSPGQHFVPVFYMGSEDADLAELNHFTVAGKKYTWQTDQTGAVGRMTVDAAVSSLIIELEQQLGVEPFGTAFCQLLRDSYQPGRSIQDATFWFVNSLFGEYGLIVLIADDARLKQQMLPVFEDDLFNHIPSKIVEATCSRLGEHYKVQASPRAINLFYLDGNIRERIERQGTGFMVVNTDRRFTEAELRDELRQHPERFSPNVILRGLFQETILPNVAFIGGGGELAYWLQLKDLFHHYGVPFPVLLLRDSLLIIERNEQQLIDKLELQISQLFSPRLQILNSLLEKKGKKIKLESQLESLVRLFNALKEQAAATDPSLEKHVEALKTKTVGKLAQLEKKLHRTERKKLEAEERQVARIKQALFPNDSLQERVENVSRYYAKWGPSFINALYRDMLPLEAKFVIMRETLQFPAELE